MGIGAFLFNWWMIWSILSLFFIVSLQLFLILMAFVLQLIILWRCFYVDLNSFVLEVFCNWWVELRMLLFWWVIFLQLSFLIWFMNFFFWLWVKIRWVWELYYVGKIVCLLQFIILLVWIGQVFMGLKLVILFFLMSKNLFFIIGMCCMVVLVQEV